MTAKTGIIIPVSACFFNNQRLNRILCEGILVIAFVIGLSAVPKQPTESLKRYLRTSLVKQTYCLVPAFFRMETL